jgi:hypothetical protein
MSAVKGVDVASWGDGRTEFRRVFRDIADELSGRRPVRLVPAIRLEEPVEGHLPLSESEAERVRAAIRRGIERAERGF